MGGGENRQNKLISEVLEMPVPSKLRLFSSNYDHTCSPRRAAGANSCNFLSAHPKRYQGQLSNCNIGRSCLSKMVNTDTATCIGCVLKLSFGQVLSFHFIISQSINGHPTKPRTQQTSQLLCGRQLINQPTRPAGPSKPPRTQTNYHAQSGEEGKAINQFL